MNAIPPVSQIEKTLVEKENWIVAKRVECTWWQDDTSCDLCKIEISGRHMIDGLVVSTGSQFGLMCADCHAEEGDGFGTGKGQLYTKLENGEWLMTYGFSEDQLESKEDED